MHGGTGHAPEDGVPSRFSRRVPVLVSVVSALVVVGPGLGRGYLLLRDMVFVPDPPLTARLLGLGHENARAVPSDLVVALASQVLPGDLVQKLVLLAVLTAAGVGAARLVPPGAVAGSAAALAAIWNPFVAERLAIGQWVVLVGYAALPWVVRGVVDVCRAGDEAAASVGRGRLVLVLALVLGALGGALAWVTLGLGLLAAGVAVAVAPTGGGSTWRRLSWVVALWAATALPWAVPAVTRPHPLGSDPAGFATFAPRADTPFGVVVALLTGGGVWNSGTVPPGRDTVVGAVAALLLLGWALAGFVLTRGARGRSLDEAAAGYRAPVVAAGGAALLVSLLSAVPGLLEPLAGAPGGGLLRDGSRQLGAWVLLLAVGCGWGARWLRSRRTPRALPWLAAVAPVAVLPSLAWGVSGLFQPVAYPADIRAAASALGAAPEPGTVAVLPFEAYRRYDWNGGLSSLTPWARLIDRRVVASSDLVVEGPGGAVRVAGEDTYAALVQRALAADDAGAALGRLGVRWLVVDAPGVAAPVGTSVVSSAPHVTVLRVDGPVDAAWPQRLDPPVAAVVAGDTVWVVAVVLAMWRTRRRSGSRGSGGEAPTIR